MKELIKEYRKTMRAIGKAKLKMVVYNIYSRNKIILQEEEYKLLSSAASDLRYSIEYMKIGRIPGNRRGVHRLSAEKREIPVDPQAYQFVADITGQSKQSSQEQSPLSSEEQNLLDDLLFKLSKREKEAYKLIRGQHISYSEAAELMGVEKGTVQYYIKMADEKLNLIVRKPDDKEVFVQRNMFSEVV